MSVTLSQTETQAFNVLRNFLLGILPAGTEVVRGIVNRVPEPASPNWVGMTPLLRTRLETTRTGFFDNGSGVTREDVAPTELTVQIDFHGPSSGDNVQAFTTLFRDDYAVEQFESLQLTNGTLTAGANLPIQTDEGAPLELIGSIDITPLYHSDPRQLAFVNGESQYEERWSVDAAMQINPVITTTLQSATEVSVGLIEVDATYPP